MKKLESSLLNMVVVLVVVAIITSGLLAWINSITAEPIQEQKNIALANGIKRAMCIDALKVASSDTIIQVIDRKESLFVVHSITDDFGNNVGAAVESTTMGFSGAIKVLVGFDPMGKVLGYDVLEHSETPGLGAKSTTWFQSDGKGSIIGRMMDTDKPLNVVKDDGDVEAITASTITSRAFLRAVNNAYAVYAGCSIDTLTTVTKRHNAVSDSNTSKMD